MNKLLTVAILTTLFASGIAQASDLEAEQHLRQQTYQPCCAIGGTRRRHLCRGRHNGLY